MKRADLILLFSLLISVPVILPYFHPGYFPTHDGEWAVVRLSDMFRSLRDFQIPVRYSGALNFGYGYPLFNFAYPFPYYLGVVFKVLGFGFVDVIKILFAASVPFSAFFMFLASRSLWKNTWAGFVSAVLYIYFPYRMVDLFVRGSIGESLSFVLFPLLFYLTIKLVGKPSYVWVSSTAISIAVLITTHNIMVVLFMPILIMFMLSQIALEKKKVIKPVILSIGLGLGISAFFWIPALFEKSNILLSRIPIANRDLHFVTIDKFVIPSWGYGVPTDPNGFSYQLGVAHFVIFIMAILFLSLLFVKNKKIFKEHLIKKLFLLTTLMVLYAFLLFKPSVFLWENILLLSEINYPWIILGILGFLTSLLAGAFCKHRITRYVVFLLSFLSVFLILPYAKPQYYVDRGDSYYLTNEATTTSSDELMPLWVKEKPAERFVEKVEIVEGVGKVENVSYNSKKITFNVNIQENAKARVNTIYYPGWNAKINSQNAVIDYSNEKGVMELVIPKGENVVELTFSETPLRIFADIISFVSISFLLFYRGILRRLTKFSV